MPLESPNVSDAVLDGVLSERCIQGVKMVAYRVSGTFSFAELGIVPDTAAMPLLSTRGSRRDYGREREGGGGEGATRRVSLIDAPATRLVVFGLWRRLQRGHVLIHHFGHPHYVT